MKNKIPTTMQAAQLDEVDGPLAIRDIPVPKPGPGQVLVRMEATPINPSDLGFMLGGYGFKEGLPATPGMEGSGIVVASGPGFMGRRVAGKRVACFGRPGLAGAWAEYLLTDARNCIPIGKDISFEQGAMSLVNPLTALAFMDIVRVKKHPGLLNTAGASALGKMLVRLCKKQGVPLISVVRREAQVEELRALGAEHILNSSDPDFSEKLKTSVAQLKVSLLLDAVGGDMMGKLLAACPRGGIVMPYGRLSSDPCVIEPGELILKNKRIVGFILTDWLMKKNIFQLLGDIRRTKRMLGDELQSPVKKRVPLAEVNEALAEYKTQMSGGKILIVPNFEGA